MGGAGSVSSLGTCKATSVIDTSVNGLFSLRVPEVKDLDGDSTSNRSLATSSDQDGEGPASAQEACTQLHRGRLHAVQVCYGRLR